MGGEGEHDVSVGGMVFSVLHRIATMQRTHDGQLIVHNHTFKLTGGEEGPKIDPPYTTEIPVLSWCVVDHVYD